MNYERENKIMRKALQEIDGLYPRHHLAGNVARAALGALKLEGEAVPTKVLSPVLPVRSDSEMVDDTPMRRAFEVNASEHHGEGCIRRGLSQKHGTPNGYINFDMNVEWEVWKAACSWQSKLDI